MLMYYYADRKEHLIMNKTYNTPKVDVVALCQDEAISAPDSFPYNDAELGWT